MQTHKFILLAVDTHSGTEISRHKRNLTFTTSQNAKQINYGHVLVNRGPAVPHSSNVVSPTANDYIVVK